MTAEEITTTATLAIDSMGKLTIEFDLDDMRRKIEGVEEMAKSVGKVIVLLPSDCLLYGIPIVWGHNAS